MALSAGARTGVPAFQVDGAKHRRELVRFLEQANLGHIACTGTFTLTANTTSTTISDTRVGPSSTIVWAPLTANAVQEITFGTLYISSRGKQTFTITHFNAATTDRTFAYVVLG